MLTQFQTKSARFFVGFCPLRGGLPEADPRGEATGSTRPSLLVFKLKLYATNQRQN